MVIDINQEKISIGAKYKIYLDRREKYSAAKKSVMFLTEIHLFDTSNSKARYQIKKNWDWPNISYYHI